jgi:hypothetical protein
MKKREKIYTILFHLYCSIFVTTSLFNTGVHIKKLLSSPTKIESICQKKLRTKGIEKSVEFWKNNTLSQFKNYQKNNPSLQFHDYILK